MSNESENEHREMAAWLTQTAAALPYPPTPNIAAAVRNQLEAPPKRTTFSLRRLTVAFVMMLVFILVAVPPTRAALFSWLQIGVVELMSGGMPVSTPVPLFNLPGRMTLTEAESAAPFPIRTPPRLGEPDAVYVQGESVLLLWQNDGVLLNILGFNMIASKMQVIEAQEVTVHGERAIWVSGEHLLTLYDNQFGSTAPFTRLIDGSVLIWVDHNLTYRLESHLPLEQAIELAESIQRRR